MRWFVLALVLSSAAAWGAPPAAPDSLRAELIGHWSYQNEHSLTDITFGEDGSFSGTLTRDGKVIWTFGGNWTLEGNRIFYTYTLSTPPIYAVGSMDLDTVQDMTPDCFTLINATTSVARACRVR